MFSSMPSPTPPAAPPKPPITWTIPHLPGIVMHQWHDGSIKIMLPPDKVEEVTEHFRQVVKSMEVGMEMIKNPPKKCSNCRGNGQIVVKNGDSRIPQVCPGCNGSGVKVHRPTNPEKLMTRNTGHTPPLPANLLPHQTHVPEQIRNDAPKLPEVQPELREIEAVDLASEFED